MSEQQQGYECTTRASDYEKWTWFKDYLKFDSAYKSGELPQPKLDFEGGPLPLEYGVEYAEWILVTPEVRDIVYRRFVLGQFDNTTEGNLLSFSKIYFCRKNGIHPNVRANFSVCLRPIAEILQGKLASPRTKEFSVALLSSSWAFFESDHH